MGSKIKLGIINEGTAGGIRKRIYNVVRHINRDLFDVTVILAGVRKEYGSEGDPIQKLDEWGVSRIVLPMAHAISPLRDFKSFSGLRALLRREDFDIVHAHSSKAGFLTRAARRLDAEFLCVYSPHVFAFHRNTGMTAKLYFHLEKIASSWGNAFIVDCEEEKQDTVRLGFADPSRIFVLPDAVDIPAENLSSKGILRKEFGTPQDATVFVSSSRLVDYKGIEIQIRAFANVVNAGNKAELWIAGDGPGLKRYQELSSSICPGDSVRFLGYRSDVNRLLNDCDCFILVSQAEGSPHSLFEALALRKPIIATAVQGISEFLLPSNGKILVPWNDVPALSAAMAGFIQNPFEGAAPETLPSSLFNIAGQIRKLEEIYRLILDTAGKKPDGI